MFGEIGDELVDVLRSSCPGHRNLRSCNDVGGFSLCHVPFGGQARRVSEGRSDEQADDVLSGPMKVDS